MTASDPRPGPGGPLGAALDLFVYAPVGLAVTAAEELPRLVAKGHSTLDTRLSMARVVGQFAVARGRQMMEQRIERAATRVSTGTADTETGGEQPADAGGPAPTPMDAGLAGRGPVAAPHSGTDAGPSASHLAIPGYDSLSASQVVQRLAGLTGEELSAVRDYEEAHRGRRTILNRVDQLQSE